MDGNYVKDSYQLAYAFDVYTENVTEADRVYVDAISGKILKSHSLVHKCFGSACTHNSESLGTTARKRLSASLAGIAAPMLTATFNLRFPRSNPTPTFEVESAAPSGFRLSMSTNIAQSLQTRRDVNNNVAWDDPEITNPTLSWGNVDQEATLAHWAVWRSYQYFLNRFGLNGTDGQGTLARVLIAPLVNNNAFWNQDQRMIIIVNHGSTNLSAVDVLAHEYGHGVSSQLVAGWWNTNVETGALNEGFSDIIGTAIERELYPTGGPNNRTGWSRLLH